MNEKLQYVNMLEIPVNTCNVSPMPPKEKKARRKKKVNPEAVKEQLLNKVNAQIVSDDFASEQGNSIEELQENAFLDAQLAGEITNLSEEITDNVIEEQNETPEYNTTSVYPMKKKKSKRFSIVGVQLCVIGVLLMAIFLTSAFVPNSGISVFFKNVFSSGQTELVDQRTFEDFAPVIAMGDKQNVQLTDGVITCSTKGSIYAPCDGVVSSFALDENGTYSIEITHCANFKTILSGVEIAYVGLNDSVYGNIPVGYLGEGITRMCFTDANGAMIVDYQIVDGSVVWAV